jgi:hypothetical protein
MLTRHSVVYRFRSGERRDVRLPDTLNDCSANADTVFITTATNRAFIWQWGRHLVELEVNKFLIEKLRARQGTLRTVTGSSAIKAMFHPLREDVVFLSCLVASAGKAAHREAFAVIKCTLGGPHAEASLQLVGRRMKPLETAQYGIQPADSTLQGSHGVATNRYGMHALHLSQERVLQPRFNVICFNTITERFYRYSRDPCYPDGSRPWLGLHWGKTTMCMSSMMNATTIRSHSRVIIHRITRHGDSGGLLASSTRGGAGLMETSSTGQNITHLLLDDGFMVFRGLDGYLVWSLAKGQFIRRPPREAGADQRGPAATETQQEVGHPGAG